MNYMFYDHIPDTVYQTLGDGLTAHNAGFHDLPWRDDAFSIAVYDGDALIGGLTGLINWRWCYIKYFWVDAAHRGRGIGRELMTRAERWARDNQCIGMHLHTLSYQGPAFYEKIGYVEFGRLDDLPPGHARIYYKKVF